MAVKFTCKKCGAEIIISRFNFNKLSAPLKYSDNQIKIWDCGHESGTLIKIECNCGATLWQGNIEPN